MTEPGTRADEGLARSAGVIGLLTLASRGLGLVRDILMASFFGTSVYMSAFVVAFRIPNLFRRIFGEGALSAAFIPVFVETVETEGRARALLLAQRTLTWLALVLAGLVVVVQLALWPAWFSPPGDPRMAHTLALLRILFPYVLLICMASLSAAILQAFRRYALPAAVPCLLNLVWIAALLVLRRGAFDTAEGIVLVAWTVLLGGVLQWFVQWPALRRRGLRLRPALPRNDPLLHLVLCRMTPAALAMAVTQFNVMIDGLLALWAGPWAPAALFFSERMIYFPLGIIATALGTVLLPTFSTHAARADRDGIARVLRYSLHNTLFIMLPAALGLAVLAPAIIAMLFEWRTFDAESTLLTARALRFYAPGLLVFSLSKIFVPAFYAMKDLRTPLRLGLHSVALNLALNLLFVWTWPPLYKHAGLALATVLAGAYYSLNLGWRLQQELDYLRPRALLSALARNLLACLPLVLLALPLQRMLAALLADRLPDVAARLLATGTAIGVSAAGYGLCSLLLHAPEMRAITTALARRLQPGRKESH